MNKKMRFDRATIVDLSGKVIAGLLKASMPVLCIVLLLFIYKEVGQSVIDTSSPEQLKFIQEYRVNSESQSLITFSTVTGAFLGMICMYIAQYMMNLGSRMDRLKRGKLIQAWLKRKAKAQLDPLPINYKKMGETQ